MPFKTVVLFSLIQIEEKRKENVKSKVCIIYSVLDTYKDT